MKKAKKNYYNQYFENHSNNMKKTWEGIRSIINVKNKNLSSISQLKVNNKIVDDSKDIAESINNYFVNVGPKTEESIPKNPVKKPGNFLKNRNQFNFLIAHLSNEEVLSIINNLENKTAGPQSIPVNLLKLIPDLILIPLCRIISKSFSTGIFPNSLKICKIIPIHKGGLTNNISNYRPISLLSIFDKIIEKLMHKRLYNFLEEHNILYCNQFGFRKNNSTSFALLQITEKIKESIDNKKYGCGIFIDLRKAFDTVNHSILLQKMEHYGVRGLSLEWFRSYLTDRKQYVFINGETSQLQDVSCGVPQGSVLGPLLFLIYINDLPNISKVLQFYLFADDTNIYYEADSPKKLEVIVNKELKKLYTWLLVNRLSLNIDKTNFIVFHPYNKPLNHKITLKIYKKALSEKDSIKYLGVMIDSTLSWHIQIDNISKKISRAIGLLYKIRPYVNIKIIKTLYYSLIYPHLLYAIEVWGSADATCINKLNVLQKRVVRLITYSDIRRSDFSFPPSDPLFYRENLLKVPDIFRMRMAKFIYNCLNKTNPSNFHSWFTLSSNVHSHRTRSQYIDIENSITSNNLFIPLARTSHYGLKLTKVYGPKLWNKLPPLLRTSNSSEIFINKLKKYMIEIYNH